MTSPPRGIADIRSIVHETIEEVLPLVGDSGVDEGLNLKQLGADSVDRVEIITGLVHRLGLKVPISDFNDIPDIAALIELLYRRAREAG